MIRSHIVLHCSDTDDGPSYSWEAIRRYHMNENGWADIGYHYGIECVGESILWLPGRPWHEDGAHTRGYNKVALGLCVVGRFDAIVPAPDIVTATIDVLAVLCHVFRIPPHNVLGHRELDQRKTCPGLQWDLAAVRARVYERLRIGLKPVEQPHLVLTGWRLP